VKRGPHQKSSWLKRAWNTLGELAIAFGPSEEIEASTNGKVAGGLVLGSTRTLGVTLRPFVVALYGMPKILVCPGSCSDVDRHLLMVARSFGARPRQLYGKVILLAIVPSVIAAMRLGVVFCLLGVLVAETFAGLRGMGALMGALANGFRAPELFAATALVSAASIAIVLALDALNERLSRWR
jgi:ABC-type nitrate/sulfonate/bicarbonate transport system permease component